MTRRNTVLISILLLLVSGQAVAESVGELRHPGLPLLPIDAHSLALGGAAEARWGLLSGLPSNPAQMLALDGVTFSTVLQLRTASSNREGNDWSESRQDFPAFQVTAALPRGFRLGAGFRADLRSRGSFDQAVELPELSYTQSFSQEGGLHRFPLTLAFPIGTKLRLGLGLSLYKGNLNQEWSWHSFRDLDGLYDGSYAERKIRRQASWHGTGLMLGVQARPLPALGVSLRWEGPADLTGTESQETAGEDDATDLTLDGHMPGRWGVGLSLKLPADGHASLQWDHEDWDSYEPPITSSELQSSDRFGFGLEWMLGKRTGRRNKQRGIPLRFGLRFGDLPATDPLVGGEVTERMLGLGTGFEIQSGRGSVDVTFFMQQLRDADGSTLEDRWGFALSLRTSEIWKKRRQPF